MNAIPSQRFDRILSRLAPLAALLLGACSASFSPEWKLDELHLLAIQAEPPEIAPRGQPAPGFAAPPDRAVLSSLVIAPRLLASPQNLATVIHLACTPIPGDLSGSSCAAYEALRDPTSLVDDAQSSSCDGAGQAGGAAGEETEWGTGIPGGVSLAGIEECDATGCRPARVPLEPSQPELLVELPAPTYVLPPELDFEALPPGAPLRKLGVSVTVVALALDAAPAELLPAEPDPCGPLAGMFKRLKPLLAERAHVLATKRIAVRGPEALDEPNRNPVLPAVAAGADLLGAPGETASVVAPGTQLELQPRLPTGPAGEPADREALLQTYSRIDSRGAVLETRREKWAYSWFATGGELETLHTQSPDELQRWSADGVPAGERVRLYTVVRDLRGGVAWLAGEVVVR